MKWAADIPRRKFAILFIEGLHELGSMCIECLILGHYCPEKFLAESGEPMKRIRSEGEAGDPLVHLSDPSIVESEKVKQAVKLIEGFFPWQRGLIPSCINLANALHE